MGVVGDTTGSAVGGFYLGVAIVIAVATYGFIRTTFPMLSTNGANGATDAFTNGDGA